jgi:hypothetical protein
MAALQSDRRRALEKVVKEARDVAEQGARAALESLAVHHHEPHSSMTPAQRDLRTRLRAHGKQLGDERDERKGGQQIDRLVAECAYEHWHRMLFARFLAENDLLIEPESGAAVTLDECAELAKGTNRDAWDIAGSFAQRMLPQVFRTDDPVLQVTLSPETRIELEKVLASLPREVFLADDSLGWTYQFWQSAEKDRVNASEVQITGRTLPAVTQLFTEHYMVLFLLHNTIGAWWAAKQMAEWTDAQQAACADEWAVRRALALPDYEFEYLRFVRDEVAKRWLPAAGAFESWPRKASQLRVLDPCCGSGHFLVAAFDLLTRLREREEGLARDGAVLAVLEANLFGLELDPRCTQIAAFALAFAAWKRIGRVRELPPLRIACSGLAIHGEREEWATLAGDDSLLRGALESLYATFAQAPELGSLVDPRRADVGGFKLTVDFEKLMPLLRTALGRHGVQRDAEQLELGVAAQGLAFAAELLAGSYTLVATNVPYLGRKSHSDTLKEWADSHDKDGKNDLATMFLSRMLHWVGSTGTVAAVTPQNWLFLTRYRALRERLLEQRTWNMVVRMGEHAFESTAAAGAFAAMVIMSGARPKNGSRMAGVDVSALRGQRPIYASEKAALLRGEAPPATRLVSVSPATNRGVEPDREADPARADNAAGFATLVLQAEQVKNPDAVITFASLARIELLAKYANAWQGVASSDYPRFGRGFWEVARVADGWVFQQSTVVDTITYGGRTEIIYWQDGYGSMTEVCQEGATFRGATAWGKPGVAVSQMGPLPVTLFDGDKFDCNCSIISPFDPAHVPAVWAFCVHGDYAKAVRSINQKLNVTNSTLAKVPFDLAYWEKIAAEKYPNGLPEPQSDDPTQWLFHGHPAGNLPLSTETNAATNTALQIAVARLAGYKWPVELDTKIRLAPEAKWWTVKCNDLEGFADDDGVIPIAPMRNEPAAESRVRNLLRAAFGQEWSNTKEATLLTAAGVANGKASPAQNLDDWLRNRFFEEHCALFHQRPFVWHIWDGRKKDGFGVLVHYHRLVAPNGAGRRLLEKLTHGYLGDWIKRQRDEGNSGKEGADARLSAALALQEKLTKILEGEPPYDLFVRWKPLHQQPIGWEPDINDGVRINIRPFIEADILRFTPKIKWTKDRGSEPHRAKADFPWFWGWDERTEDFAGGSKFTGERFNDLHYTTAFKRAARERRGER